MKRRDFVKSISIAATVAAMCPPTLAEPSPPILYGDGVHDDTEALQALIDGKQVIWPTGELASPYLPEKAFLISSTLVVGKHSCGLFGRNSTIKMNGGSLPGIMFEL